MSQPPPEPEPAEQAPARPDGRGGLGVLLAQHAPPGEWPLVAMAGRHRRGSCRRHGRCAHDEVVEQEGPLVAQDASAATAALSEAAGSRGVDGPLAVANKYLSAVVDGEIVRAVKISGEDASPLVTDAAYRSAATKLSAP